MKRFVAFLLMLVLLAPMLPAKAETAAAYFLYFKKEKSLND